MKKIRTLVADLVRDFLAGALILSLALAVIGVIGHIVCG